MVLEYVATKTDKDLGLVKGKVYSRTHFDRATKRKLIADGLLRKEWTAPSPPSQKPDKATKPDKGEKE